MGQYEALFWKYVDHDCTAAEQAQVKELLSNPTYYQEFKIIADIHAQLGSVTIEKAPEDLISNTLLAINTVTTKKSSYTSINYKPILSFLGFLIILPILFLPFQWSSMSQVDMIQQWIAHFPTIEVNPNYWAMIGSMGLALLTIPCIALLDKLAFANSQKMPTF